MLFFMKLITSAQNSLIKHLLKLQKDSSYRKECQSIFLEGRKIVEEAFLHFKVKNCVLEQGLITEHPATFLSSALIQKISNLKSSEGYFLEIERPSDQSLEGLEKILVLDRLQNPGNMGTLIRTALAFGYEGIFILDDSVDPYSPKVLRASMGASLYVPIYQGSQEELTELAEKNKMDVFIADAKGDPLNKNAIKTPFMLVLGNESTGSQLNSDSDFKKISLPIENVDSLNVAIAGSLLMYLMGNPS